ncbi:hypothetical protein ACFX13_022195 [Malus domestica]
MASQVSSPRPNTPLPTGNHDYQGYRRQVTAANMENHHGAPQNLQRPNYNTPLPTGDHDYQGYRLQVTAANMENHHGAPQNLQRPNYNTPLPTGDHDYQGYRLQVTAANMENHHGAPQNLQRPNYNIKSYEAAEIHGGILTEWYGTRIPTAKPINIRRYYSLVSPLNIMLEYMVDEPRVHSNNTDTVPTLPPVQFVRATRGPVANGKEIRSKKPPRGKW